MRGKGDAGRLPEVGVDKFRGHAAGLVGYQSLIGVIEPVRPHRVSRPKQAHESGGLRQLQQARPVRQATDAVRAIHIEAVSRDQYVLAQD